MAEGICVYKNQIESKLFRDKLLMVTPGATSNQKSSYMLMSKMTARSMEKNT